MSDAVRPAPKRRWFNWRRWRNRKAADPGFQSWAAGVPLARGAARKDGEALFDLVAGFVHSQALMALVELGVLDALRTDDLGARTLAARAAVPDDRMVVLLNAGVALDLLERVGENYGLSRKGAALIGAPGLTDMIRHHRVLYRDLEDPAAFLRGETETELAGFWPYVFGAAGAEDPETAARYSHLMAESQRMVAEETLRAISLKDVNRLMDVGGGTGAFLTAAGAKYPDLRLTLMDLPAVVPEATERFARAGLAPRATIRPGDFRQGDLPDGADAISLVRVLYDHGDETVAKLLADVREALPQGGRLIISEPMTGGAVPTRPGDVYFAFYCMAMRTGRARSADEIAALLTAAGFAKIRRPLALRPFITTALEAVR
ncbi:MAG: methyltransferase [Pseudomonadota bacterium]